MPSKTCMKIAAAAYRMRFIGTATAVDVIKTFYAICVVIDGLNGTAEPVERASRSEGRCRSIHIP